MLVNYAEVSREFLEDYHDGFHLTETPGLRVMLWAGELMLSDGLMFARFDWSKDHEYCEQVGKARLNGFSVQVRVSDLHRTVNVQCWPQREGRNGGIPKGEKDKRILLLAP